VERKHGGNIYQVARQMGINADKIIDFSANINPLGYSSCVNKIFDNPEGLILNYPDEHACDFINALSSYHDLPTQCFLAGNGSTEFICLLPSILRPKSVLIVAPAFTEYGHSFQRAKGVVFYSDTQESDCFAIQQKKLAEELKRGYSAFYICNPVNPTGMLIPQDIMKGIVSNASKKATAVIIDETFMDFNEAQSMKSQVAKFDNLIILRSMTKFFALPGLRNGYIISQTKNIEKIRERIEPWSINNIAQHAGIESLKDGQYIQKTVKYINEARAVLCSSLKTIPSLTVFNSRANFILIKLKDSARINAVELSDRLLKKALMIRTCEDFHGLSDRFFRVAVKKKNDNKKLVAELRKILVRE
jgi:threonine-phosphate decarboxylase